MLNLRNRPTDKKKPIIFWVLPGGVDIYIPLRIFDEERSYII